MSSTCRSCDAEVVWITSRKGKPMICNAQLIQGIEDPQGTLRLILSDGSVKRARPLRGREPHIGQPFVEGRVSHWATCPQAGEWRR